MLFWSAIVAAGSAVLLQSIAKDIERQKELELAESGAAIVNAIRAYYESSPGTAKELPKSLADLLLDPRKLYLERHLRSIPHDPFTGKQDWVLIAPRSVDATAHSGMRIEGDQPSQIVGVCSRTRCLKTCGTEEGIFPPRPENPTGRNRCFSVDR
jgi:type II secretory pathway pseudopilin PulG